MNSDNNTLKEIPDVSKNLSIVSKNNFTDAQKKLSTDLLQLIGVINLPDGISRNMLEQQMNQNRQLKWVDDSGATINETTGHKLVYVYITTGKNTNESLIKASVWNITDIDPANNLVVAWVDTNNLINLASLESVQSIQTVTPPMTK